MVFFAWLLERLDPAVVLFTATNINLKTNFEHRSRITPVVGNLSISFFFGRARFQPKRSYEENIPLQAKVDTFSETSFSSPSLDTKLLTVLSFVTVKS